MNFRRESDGRVRFAPGGEQILEGFAFGFGPGGDEPFYLFKGFEKGVVIAPGMGPVPEAEEVKEGPVDENGQQGDVFEGADLKLFAGEGPVSRQGQALGAELGAADPAAEGSEGSAAQGEDSEGDSAGGGVGAEAEQSATDRAEGGELSAGEAEELPHPLREKVVGQEGGILSAGQPGEMVEFAPLFPGPVLKGAQLALVGIQGCLGERPEIVAGLNRDARDVAGGIDEQAFKNEQGFVKPSLMFGFKGLNDFAEWRVPFGIQDAERVQQLQALAGSGVMSVEFALDVEASADGVFPGVQMAGLQPFAVEQGHAGESGEPENFHFLAVGFPEGAGGVGDIKNAGPVRQGLQQFAVVMKAGFARVPLNEIANHVLFGAGMRLKGLQHRGWILEAGRVNEMQAGFPADSDGMGAAGLGFTGQGTDDDGFVFGQGGDHGGFSFVGMAENCEDG